MTNKEAQIIKEEIIHWLCDDWNNGAHKENQAIFDRKDGRAIYSGTDLEMVMDKVVNALYVCKDKVGVKE